MSVASNDPRHPPDLKGLRVLVVEDEPIIAFDLADAVEAANGVVLGPALTIRDALRLVDENGVEGAILDVNLPDGDIGPVLAVLALRNAVMVLHTGAGLPEAIRGRHPNVPIFLKPTPTGVLLQSLMQP